MALRSYNFGAMVRVTAFNVTLTVNFGKSAFVCQLHELSAVKKGSPPPSNEEVGVPVMQEH